MTVMDHRASWADVCRYDELMPDRGACTGVGAGFTGPRNGGCVEVTLT
jgi:hypothetical protein